MVQARIDRLKQDERNFMNAIIARDAGLVWDIEQLARGNRTGVLSSDRYDNLNPDHVRDLVKATYDFAHQDHPLRHAVNIGYVTDPNANQVLTLGLQSLFSPNIQRITEAALSGDWRQLRGAHGQWHQNMAENITNWYAEDLTGNFSRGDLADYLVNKHSIDVARISEDVLKSTVDRLIAMDYRKQLDADTIYRVARRP